MNADIANILKSYIEPLDFVDRITGLVRPIIKTDVVEMYNDDNELIGEQVIKKIFPVSCSVTHEECFEGERYMDLVPNSDYRSIIYFEDKGTILTGMQGKRMQFMSALRLVCWLNLDMFDTTSCTLSAPVMAAIIHAIPTSHFNDGNYQGISAKLTSIPPKDASIFGAYTYNEETNQHLLYPYDYFALDLNIDFMIHESCINAIVIKDKTC